MKRTTSAFCPAALLFFSTKETISFVAIGMGRNARGSSSWSLFAAVRRFPTGIWWECVAYRISAFHVRLNCEERLLLSRRKKKMSKRENFFLLFFSSVLFVCSKNIFLLLLSLGAPSLPPQPDFYVAKFFWGTIFHHPFQIPPLEVEKLPKNNNISPRT